jgi:Ca2+-binding EF-hand superfamily protein
MGSLLSCSTATRRHYLNIYSTEPEIVRWRPVFEALRLCEADIGRLRRIFRSIDVDNSGSIELLELLMYMDIERTPFTKRIFSIFDDDGSNTVDFKEFVMALWNYCTLGKATLLLFAFDIYDRDTSGELTVDEIVQMLRDVYGSSFQSNAHASIILKRLHDLQVNSLSGVDIDTFRGFAGKHQALLYPAFEIQRVIQRRILGEEFWNLLSLRRIELSNGKYMPIGEFMILHINRDMYDKHVKSTLVKKKAERLKDSAKTVIKSTGSKATRMNRQQLSKDCVSNMTALNSISEEGAVSKSLQISKQQHAKRKSFDGNLPICGKKEDKNVVPIDVCRDVRGSIGGSVSRRRASVMALSQKTDVTKTGDNVNLNRVNRRRASII